MTTATPSTLPATAGWFARAEAWLDDKGKVAWLAAMVLGFVFFWPVGLALLFYMIWSKRMMSCRKSRTARMPQGFRTMRSSGNAAFDAYKAETLRRLEEEQDGFEAFLKRLRDARDKAEFDQFMEERSRRAGPPATDAETSS
ncbi:hypothetical protein OCH239_14140 [Roseivivax halodurans JCM 10272]|uniref:DUF2852 domain-containing protein n=1 Tax=Roseivivax halodurans JCM 10272 TaxID=1449350 RepID=X7EI77_9RHOB|nr:DUF2852 domain-containing protein [Roseivivax halodurans]ETX15585.1 hypothetical protein OCH239_14140 [Roseivivax halodurans JCM 10272]